MATFALRLCLLYLAFAMPAAAASASKCPFIRPPGLSAQQVDAVVLRAFAQWLHKPAPDLDTSRTVKSLDGTGNAGTTYAFAVLAISQALGFDGLRLFAGAAAAKGAKQPFESMSIAELQALTREAYAHGHDEPPPVADASAEYAVNGLPVRVPPAPVGEWRLLHCGADDVTFLQQGSEHGAFAATVREGSLAPYTSDAEFLQQFSASLRATLPAPLQAQPWQPTIVKGTATPCADLTLNAVEAGSGRPGYFRIRVCYAARDKPYTWAVMFSEWPGPGEKPDPAPAEAFIAATSPK